MPDLGPRRLLMISRVFELLRLISLRPMVAKELADEMGMTQHTVYRYVWALQRVGLRILSKRSARGFLGYVIEQEGCPVCGKRKE